jgi:hypothetical protein
VLESIVTGPCLGCSWACFAWPRPDFQRIVVLAFRRALEEVVRRFPQPMKDDGGVAVRVTVEVVVVSRRSLAIVESLVESVTVVAVGVTVHAWFRKVVSVLTLATASLVER